MEDYPYEYYNRKKAERKAFFWKSILFFVIITIVILSAIILFCRPSKARFEVSLYFVAADVSESKAEEISKEIRQKGGAGFVFSINGKLIPLYACYYTSDDANRVSERLTENGENAVVVEKNAKALYFTGTDEKDAKEDVCKLVRSAYESSLLLFDIANGLESGTMKKGNALSAAADCVDTFLFSFESVKDCSIYKQNKYKDYFSFYEQAEKFSVSLDAEDITSQSAREMQTRLCCFLLSSFEMFGK